VENQKVQLYLDLLLLMVQRTMEAESTALPPLPRLQIASLQEILDGMAEEFRALHHRLSSTTALSKGIQLVTVLESCVIPPLLQSSQTVLLLETMLFNMVGALAVPSPPHQ
jgi:hypothetical protein